MGIIAYFEARFFKAEIREVSWSLLKYLGNDGHSLGIVPEEHKCQVSFYYQILNSFITEI